MSSTVANRELVGRSQLPPFMRQPQFLATTPLDLAVQVLLRPTPPSRRDPHLERASVPNGLVRLDQELAGGVRPPAPLLDQAAPLLEPNHQLGGIPYVDHDAASLRSLQRGQRHRGVV